MSRASGRRGRYSIRFTPRFGRDFNRLPREVKRRIIEKIEDLKGRPHALKRLHGRLRGLYALRIGEYRVIYLIDDEHKEVILISVAHRRRIYSLR